jgi:hypothetical protein
MPEWAAIGAQNRGIYLTNESGRNIDVFPRSLVSIAKSMRLIGLKPNVPDSVGLRYVGPDPGSCRGTHIA